MPDPAPRRAATAGGFPIIAGILLGAGIGFGFHQPTIGLLIGGSIGIAIATAIWLRGR